MTASSEYARLQVLLHAAWRNDQGVEAAQKALRALGVEVTATGKTSVSARATADTVSRVFGEVKADELSVPASLAEYVESITIAPQYIVMSDRPEAGKRRDKP